MTAATTQLEVGRGQRVAVLADLLLPATATPASRAQAADLAQMLRQWEGPGLLVIAGNLFASLSSGGRGPAERAAAAVRSHAPLAAALQAFAAGPQRRVLVLPGWRDPEVATDPEVAGLLGSLGAEVMAAVDLRLHTVSGTRRVMVRAGAPAADPGPPVDEDATPTWLSGIDRLEDRGARSRFVTSRIFYRRLARPFAWAALLPLAAALALRLRVVVDGLGDVPGSSVRTRRVLADAYRAAWPTRLVLAVAAAALVVAVLAVAVAVASRLAWRALGGAPLAPPWRRAPDGLLDVPDPAPAVALSGGGTLDQGQALTAGRAAGLIVGGSLRPELLHLHPGFYASPGGTTEVVREHRGRFGLPPVFVHHRQAAWVELETGAELHVRLLHAEVHLHRAVGGERLSLPGRFAGPRRPERLDPSTVASWPAGPSWPPPPEDADLGLHRRRARRVAAVAVSLAGAVDLLEAITPPLRSRLALVEQILPLGVARAAGALVALAGVGLLVLGRGVRRGQRRAWAVAVGLLAVTATLHLVHAASVGAAAVALAVLGFMVVQRRHFAAAADRGSLRPAVATLLAGPAAAVGAAVAVESGGALGHHPLPPWWTVVAACAERLVGLQGIPLPDGASDWVTPGLLTVGVALGVVSVVLLTRPVVDRRLSARSPSHAGPSRSSAERRARDIVRRHGTGSLDYFALRDDKQWFFHRDSLVAYAVHGGVCLVSPDPIGPPDDRRHVWHAFRAHADRHGWAVAVLGAAEEWLPAYRATGMRHLYIGDEALVDVRRFSLAGGDMKGLRQAVNRIARYGYRAEILDPAAADPGTAASVRQLMARGRRGDEERGFSMSLGRVFDTRDDGLLMTVVRDPSGEAVAVCQFVPSPAVGGYSLDLMRRDPGGHPNGLLDFALVRTIEHLRDQGLTGLSLNFATMRATLESENGDGLTRRMERWALRRLSGVLQIESLWRFNAKYGPAWQPRFVAWDSPEQFVPAAVQILRAESLTEIPVVGRLLTPRGPHHGSRTPEVASPAR